MTPTQIDHLRPLKSHLENLLETAKKRTPGDWFVDSANGVMADYIGSTYICYPDTKEDAAFIASCAGNAEAGWKSALAAIEWLLRIYEKCDEPTSTYAEQALQEILAAWPIETLQK